jgi:hypothetical protein
MTLELHAINKEINLKYCSVGLDLDSRLQLSGLSGAGVVELGCSATRCKESGLFGICKRREYTLSTHVSFGSLVSARGLGEAEWDLCGLFDANHSIEVGFDVRGPGIASSILVEHEYPISAKITEVDTLDIDWGRSENYQCGFDQIPGFIGSKLEDWCTSILEWLVKSFHTHLLGDVDGIIKGLINKYLEMPPEEDQKSLLTSSASIRTKRHSSDTIDLKLHFPDAPQASCEAVLFSVGTAVDVNGYDSLAQALTKRNFVVAIVDPQKGNPTKLSVEKLHAAYTHVKENLVDLAGDKCQSVSKWIVGGHSAGGGTAHKVFAQDSSMADAVFSVDPFSAVTPSPVEESHEGRSSEDTIIQGLDIPSLFWGFDVTTCFVSKEKAAKGHYEATTPSKRVFVRAKRIMQWCDCGHSPKYYHCSIVDGGCMGCMNCMDTPVFFFEDVANSVRIFVDNLKGNFEPSFDFTTETDVFVGETSVA